MKGAASPILLTVGSVGRYLRDRGLIGADDEVEAIELGGGVSNVVIAVRAGTLRAVVKQALPRLRVPDEWLAKRERVLNEALALEVTGRLTTAHVPRVLDTDPTALAITIERAPDGWTDWKQQLLAGHIDPGVAATLGTILAAWHAGTSAPGTIPSSLDDREAFDQLRVDPYYRTVMIRRPEIAGAVGRHVERMLATRQCLVHGDFSPKNVLVGAGPQSPAVWVIDFEVAHLGDPAFDLAFMHNHLMLKAIHEPSNRHALAACASSFWESYCCATPQASPAPYVLGHVGCLMVARVDGKSPAEYLQARAREVARRLGCRFATDPPKTIGEAWDILRETLVDG